MRSRGNSPEAWIWRWPLVVAVLALAVTTVALVWVCTTANGGTFTYGIDDAYIHMAMAKNLAGHGVWGITPHAFSATSSSPAWTLLLAACFYAFGVREIIPLLLNVLAAIGVTLLCFAVLSRQVRSRVLFAGVLLLIMAAIPFPALLFTGMEHTVQILVNLSFALLCTRVVGKRSVDGQERCWLFILSALVTAHRQSRSTTSVR